MFDYTSSVKYKVRKELEFLGMGYFQSKSLVSYIPDKLLEELLYTLDECRKSNQQNTTENNHDPPWQAIF